MELCLTLCPIVFLSIPDIDEFKPALDIFPLLYFKVFNGFDQWGQFLKSVISGVKIGLFLLQKATYIAQERPALLIGKVGYRGGDQPNFLLGNLINAIFFAFLFIGCFRTVLFRLVLKYLDINKLVTGHDK